MQVDCYIAQQTNDYHLNRAIFILICSLLSIVTLDVVGQGFTKSYENLSSSSFPVSSTVLADGNNLLTASSLQQDVSFLTKVDSLGKVVWAKQISFTNNGLVGHVVALPDSGFAALFNTTLPGHRGFSLARFNARGDVLWCKRLDQLSASSDLVAFKLLYKDGELFNAVQTTGTFDNGVCKWDMSGKLLWQNMFLVGYSRLSDIQVNRRGNVELLLVQRSSLNNGYNSFLELNGNTGSLNGSTWSFKSSFHEADYLAMDTIENGGRVIIGKEELGNGFVTDSCFFMVKLDSLNQIIWSKNYCVNGDYGLFSPRVFTLSDGDLLIRGGIVDYARGNVSSHLVRLSSVGAIKYSTTVSGFFPLWSGLINQETNLLALHGSIANQNGNFTPVIQYFNYDEPKGCDSVDMVTTPFHLVDSVLPLTPRSSLNLSVDSLAINDYVPLTYPECFCADTLSFSLTDTLKCSNASMQVTLPDSFIYEWEPDVDMSCEDCYDPVFTNTGTKKFYVTIYHPDSCAKRDSITVNVLTAPEPDLGIDTVVCSSDTIQLNPGSFTNYMWQDGSTDSIFNLDSTSFNSNWFFVDVENQFGCTERDSIYVFLDPSSQLIGQKAFQLCPEDTIPTNFVGSNTYSWFPRTGLDCYTCPNPKLTSGSASKYIVYLDSSQLCDAVDSIQIQHYSSPTTSLLPSVDKCDRDELILDPGSFASYAWSDGSFGPDLKVPSNSGSGWYVVTVTDNNGCSTTDSTYVNEIQSPNPSISGDTMICDGTPVQLTASGAGSDGYLWENNDTAATVIVNQPGWFWLESSEGGICSVRDSIFIVERFSPFVPEMEAHYTMCEGEDLSLSAISGNADFYLLNGDSVGSIFTIYQQGDYLLEVTNDCGTTTRSFKVDDRRCNCDVFIANAFSPNLDGLNEEIGPSINCENITDYEFVVVNRWGEEVFYTESLGTNWNGLKNGSIASGGVFAYRINFKHDGNFLEFYGRFYIIR